MFGPSASSLVIIYVFGLVLTYIDSYLMQLFADHSPVPSKSRDPMKTAINYSALRYFGKACLYMNVKAAGALQRKCLNKVVIIIGKGKGKAIPLQTWIGPECSRRLRLPDFKIFGT